MRIISNEMMDRAYGCLFGQLAGDSLGSLVEFKDALEIADLYPGGVRDLKDGGTWNLLAGQPTDDSEMALALARAITARQGFEESSVAEAYIRWWKSEPFDIGFTTSSGLSALSIGQSAKSDSQANGALMRVSPVGIYAAGNPALAAKVAARDAALTHPHPICQSASSAYAAAIASGIGGDDPATMWQTAWHYAHHSPETAHGSKAVRERLILAKSEPPYEFYDQMGWVLTALQNAFFHLLSNKSLEEAVIWTVGSGGDTDTNAAVCGALLGAAQGGSAVPDRWCDTIAACRPTIESGAAHPRPPEYWPTDAGKLTEALLLVSLQTTS